MLKAENLNKQIDGKQILENIHLCLLPSQITAVIGANGSGKSTLLRALSLVDCPTHGEIIIDDLSFNFPSTVTVKAPWPKLAVVFQQHFLWPHLTIRENISMPARANNILNFESEFEKIVTALNLKEFLDRYPNQVSGGQRQRSALARALILKPKYLLLDEVTASLDIEQIREIMNYLQILKHQGTSILIITHLIGLAKQIADRVVFLEKGKIIEQGTPMEVIENSSNLHLRSFLEYSL